VWIQTEICVRNFHRWTEVRGPSGAVKQVGKEDTKHTKSLRVAKTTKTWPFILTSWIQHIPSLHNFPIGPAQLGQGALRLGAKGPLVIRPTDCFFYALSRRQPSLQVPRPYSRRADRKHKISSPVGTLSAPLDQIRDCSVGNPKLQTMSYPRIKQLPLLGGRILWISGVQVSSVSVRE